MPASDPFEDISSEASGQFAELRNSIRRLVDQRGWRERDTPKNLVMALSVEVAELMEPFQWLSTGTLSELGDELDHVKLEIADVLIYLIALADGLEIDLYKSTSEKIMLLKKTSPPF